MTYDEINEIINNYYVDNKIVYKNQGKQKIVDEDTILKVKSAYLIFNEAKRKYIEDKEQFKDRFHGTKENYIKRTMERFSVNNEVNTFGENIIVNDLLNSNGHYESNMLGDDFKNSKLSFLFEPKKDYGIAFLKMKFREKGLDIENLIINIDTSRFKKDGYSTIKIDFGIKKYNKKENERNSLFRHPKADLLNELEKQKRDARMHNDEVAYNYAQSNIERIIKENPVMISDEEYEKLNNIQKKAFIDIKIRESQVLKNKKMYDMWQEKLKNINNELDTEKKSTDVEVDIFKDIANKNSSYYQELMKLIQIERQNPNMNDEELNRIRTSVLYNIMGIVSTLQTEKECQALFTSLVKYLNKSNFETEIMNYSLMYIKKRLSEINNKENKMNKNGKNFLEKLKVIGYAARSISQEFHEMLSDKVIDDEELEILIKRITQLEKEAKELESYLDRDNRHSLDAIINQIIKEKQKLLNMQNFIEKNNGFRL